MKKFEITQDDIQSGLLQPILGRRFPKTNGGWLFLIETNGRGMLHLHWLVWLQDAHHLSDMWRRLLHIIDDVVEKPSVSSADFLDRERGYGDN